MQQLQLVFTRIQEAKNEAKEIKAMYKDALNNSAVYQRSLEELKKLKGEKKKFEDSIKAEFSVEFDKLEVLNNEIKNDSQLLSDMAISEIVKGKNIEITDKYENKFEPLFKVSFKKIN